MQKMIQIVVLGSTGSIGKIVLSIVRKYPRKFKIIALVANNNVQLISEQCIEFSPKYVILSNERSSKILNEILKNNQCPTKVLFGKNKFEELSNINSVNYIVSAITGIDGLIPTIKFVRKGRKILLANKESLISCGKLFLEEVKKYESQILPIDSEINAIFRMLPKDFHSNLGFFNLEKIGINKITLTGSGGPFLTLSNSQLDSITPEEACRHPKWKMGKKISVDSATMINKGFEYIEAKYFFNIDFDQIEILIHPQSVVHAMIHCIDGSVIAKLGVPKMITAISYGMFYPSQCDKSIQETLDLKKIHSLTFLKPNYEKYPCLKLVMEVCQSGRQSKVTALNAANEIAVSAFLSRKIKFTDIFKINSEVLERSNFQEPKTIEEIVDIDFESRKIAIQQVKSYH
ncbi:1-deoxy-D-xylulose-5-phosphate reductoisomerase [Candidatus Riesia pediculicola]|uniref:1-deoxy-D-xylulose 5-phosphate reductoisomerase n=1 Tax=Riesia pediculicola (strain USDA) TaxID=515618 RepID=D4G8E5_RIEPU|nr:1-deoxy-D-xylulose-5-phosphate reductoisomerase [Candidatus Riesia pediculicola]ADD79709.1 1-deoxy-D-xylulose 5-phosphate reductoisomerase [Candidatus Riesia pediculicola USDA]